MAEQNSMFKKGISSQTETSEKSANAEKENTCAEKKENNEDDKTANEKGDKSEQDNQLSPDQLAASVENKTTIRDEVRPPSKQFLVKREDFFVFDKETIKTNKIKHGAQSNFLRNFFQRSAVELKNKKETVKANEESAVQTTNGNISLAKKGEVKINDETQESNKSSKNEICNKHVNSESEEIIIKKRKPRNLLQNNKQKVKSKTKTTKTVKKAFTYMSESDTDEEENQRILGGHPSNYDKILLMKLEKDYSILKKLKSSIEDKIEDYKESFFYEQQVELKRIKSDVPENGVPVCADVTSYDFKKLIAAQRESTGRLFDVIMMDPPWQLSTSQPSRGVAIAYSSLPDDSISRLPIGELQKSGFLLIWVINAKYSVACNYFKKWGYQFVDEVVWVKRTVTGKIAKGHGFYLQHAKETCLVGFKGDIFDFKAKKYCALNGLDIKDIEAIKVHKKDEIMRINLRTGNDIIFSERRGQSQKPNEIYSIVEGLVPNGHYLEIFGRRNNIHNRWVTLGNEL